jgi:hypothetical protein
MTLMDDERNEGQLLKKLGYLGFESLPRQRQEVGIAREKIGCRNSDNSLTFNCGERPKWPHN